MRLSKETRAEIEQLRRQTRDKKQHIRLSVLIMLDEGFTNEMIGVSLGIDSDIVGNYKQKYLQQGLQAYLKDNYVAYQGELTKEQLQQLHQKVEEGLYQTAREVGDYIFGEFKVDYSDSAVRAILTELDFVQSDGTILVDYKTGAIFDEDEQGARHLKEAYLAQMKLYAYLHFEATGQFPEKIYLEPLFGKEVIVEINLSDCLSYAQTVDQRVDSVNYHITHLDANGLQAGDTIICKMCQMRPACRFYQPAFNADKFADIFGKLSAVKTLNNGSFIIVLNNESGESRITGLTQIDAESLDIGNRLVRV